MLAAGLLRKLLLDEVPLVHQVNRYANLGKAQQQERDGVPVPDEPWRLGPYLEYWLENFVKRNRRRLLTTCTR